MSEEKVRLSKLMAARGLCSRREADDFIARGLVLVDGEVVNQLGTKVAPDAHISLAAEADRRQQSLVTIILNKPVGYVSAQPEPPHVPAVTLITPANQFVTRDEPHQQRLKPEHLRGLAVAGRLDIDSQGLLLFTQDGRLARQIIGAESEVEKEYLVRVFHAGGELPADKLALLRSGLELDGRPLKPAHVEWVNRDQLRFVLHEGRKRQIRRMCELVGLKVTGLKRVRVGELRLGNLPEGKWRFLRPAERVV
jgi:23S rRNA pseudouridine2604 synthase